jgi:hypothetical protein
MLKFTKIIQDRLEEEKTMEQITFNISVIRQLTNGKEILNKIHNLMCELDAKHNPALYKIKIGDQRNEV